MSLPLIDTEAPVNIFRELRLASGLSHQQLAVEMRTSKRALIWLEQGTYDRPLPVALNFWLNEGRFLPGIKNSGIRITELTLVEGYELFQEETRELHRGYFGASLLDLNFDALCPSPCIQLRDKARRAGNDDSLNAIAKALCVPFANLSTWENKWRTLQSVPKTIQSALLAIGYTRYEVKRLVDGYVIWRELQKVGQK